MTHYNRRGLAISAALLGTFALAVPSASFAKTYKVTVKSDQVVNGTSSAGTSQSKVFGKCKLKGTINYTTNRSVIKWTCKGGTFSFDSTLKLTGGTKGEGPVKFGKGTGKFKGIKGSAITKGDIVNGKFTTKGKVSF